jgi:hypothetical protein
MFVKNGWGFMLFNRLIVRTFNDSIPSTAVMENHLHGKLSRNGREGKKRKVPLREKKINGSGTRCTHPREYN